MLQSFKKFKKISIGLVLVFVTAPLMTSPGWADTTSKKKKSSSSPFHIVPNVHEDESVPLSNGYPPVLIGPGDLLAIFVYGESQLATEYRVDADGTIIFPYLGPVKLAGYTPNEASEKLANALFKPRKVSILIKESNTYWISVIGEVGHPGKYQIKGKPDLLSTLSEAGGPANDSDIHHAILIHQNVRIPVDLSLYLRGKGPMEPQPFLYPGDVLVVPKEGWPNANDILGLVGVLATIVAVTVEIHQLN